MARLKAKSPPALEDVELPYSAGHHGRRMAPDEMAELEAGWRAHRDEIMEEHDRPDWRPLGWWAFEARQPMRPDG